MRKLTVMAFVTADGVMQAPGGPQEDPSGGFAHGGWVVPYWDDEIQSALAKAFEAPFDLLLGRRTYDIFAAHWPHVAMNPQDEGYNAESAATAKKFNDCTKYVVTHRAETLDWARSEAVSGDVAASIEKLKASEGPDLLVQGSSEVLQLLHSRDLVDEFHLVVYPVVLGSGKRLFGAGTVPRAFEAARTNMSPSGVCIVNYGRSGNVDTGSFAFDEPTPAELKRREDLGKPAG